jgi:hypothetical protein
MMPSDTAEQSKDRLNEERRFDQPTIREMRQVVEVGRVVTLELEPRTISIASLKNIFDVFEGIAEDEVL